MLNRLTFVIFLSFLSLPVFGEYRVYQYYVRSKTQNIDSGNATLVTSTLNPSSYASYHGGKLSVEVNLLRSWVCMGDTSKQDICTMSEGKELAAGGIQ